MKKSILDKKKKIREKISNLRSSFDTETLINSSLNAQLNLLEFLKKKNFKMLDFTYHLIMKFLHIICFLSQKKKLFQRYLVVS